MPKLLPLLVTSAMVLALIPLAAPASVTPTFYAGATNRTCAEFDDGYNETWNELKADTGAAGTYTMGNLTVTISNRTDDTFSWTSNIGVDAVFVKGGSRGSNLYRYDPESTGDTSLGVPSPTNNGISHISFCWDDDPFVPPESVLTLFKAPLQPIVDLGQTIGFALILGNGGGDPAENATIWDTLPAVSGNWSADNGACTVNATNLTCSFGTLAVGEFRYVNVTAGTAVVDDCGPWTNVAYAVANDGLGTNAASSDPAEVYVTCADVSVVKTGGAPVNLGANVTFGLLVTSHGPDGAENVTLADALPLLSGGWTLGGDNATDCAIADGALSCSFGALPANATRSVTLTGATGAASDCGWANNTATIAARLDTSASNNASSASRYVLCSDVLANKTAAASSVYLGTNVTFTILVTSEGPDAAENVTLVDALPTVPSAWEIVASDPTCAIDSGTLSCAFGTVPAGETRSVTLTSSTGDASTDCGAVTNSATAGADVDLDGNDSASSASVSVLCSDLSLAKTAGGDVYLGGNVTFTLTVTSEGPDAALHATLVDALPTAPSAWAIAAAEGTCAIELGILTCEFGALDPGAQRNVTVTSITSAASDCGPILNVATASALVDTNATNNDANATATVRCSDVSAAKAAGASNIDVGANASFTLTITSHGPDAALNATLTDTLPAVAGGWTVGTPDGGACMLVNQTLTCGFGTLQPGEQRNVTLVAATTLADCGLLANSVVSDADVNLDATNDNATAAVYVTCADVGVAKSASASNVTAGQNVTWWLTITSLGPDAATGITVLDQLPNGSVLGLSGNASAYCSEANGNVTCSIPSLGAGQSLVLQIVSSTALVPCGWWNNTALVRASLDTDATNNASSASVEVRCPIATTRTQGFWSTHTAFTRSIFAEELGGTMTVGAGGHVRMIDTDGKLFGAWYASIPTKTDGSKRTQADAGRIALLQQLVTAKLNCAAFGCNATTQSIIAAADGAYAAGSKATMAGFAAALDAYNNGGDAGAIPAALGPWGPATPDVSRAIANRVFWNAP